LVLKRRSGTWAGTASTAALAAQGKTDLLRWYPWQQIQAEDARLKAGEHMEQSTGHALVLRRETPQLRELMNRCRNDFEQANPAIEWSATDKTWEWPNGYRYTVGHMENEEDWMKYQGWQISCLCMDEGTTFIEKQFSMIDAWVRQPKGSYLTPIIRMGSNPVGVGKKWVRKFFVEAGYGKKEAPRYWGKPVIKELEVPIIDDDGRRTTEKRKLARLFVPARVSDNKSVDQGDYAATLVDKPDYIRKAILEGDWYAISEETWANGIVDEEVHFIKPFKVPASWYKFRACKFGNVWPVLLRAVVCGGLTRKHDVLPAVRNRRECRRTCETIRSIEMDNNNGRIALFSKRPERRMFIWMGVGRRLSSHFVTRACFQSASKGTGAEPAHSPKAAPHPTNRDKDGSQRNPGIRWFETARTS
jgi:hypothetical protein